MEGRFLAFAGPHAERQCSPGGYYNLRPEDYITYFKRKNVALVVRLNKPYYDAKKFTSQGIDHMELYFIGECCAHAVLVFVLTRSCAGPADGSRCSKSCEISVLGRQCHFRCLELFCCQYNSFFPRL
jgi:hypothetical protein